MADEGTAVPGTEVLPGQHPNSRANLRPPWKPGESGNRAGTNQYTYREDTERLFAGQCVDDVADVIRKLFEKAKGGNDKHIKLILERAFPAVKQVDHELAGADVAGLVDGLTAFFAKQRDGGSDVEPDETTEGSGE